ncbi:MAG TPA: hypothetical protein VLG49_04810 [Rhabdochlamydiaceae bacterium]|nr:hypothetical protein [Rhabdochlamydiaceae bacterium]
MSLENLLSVSYDSPEFFDRAFLNLTETSEDPISKIWDLKNEAVLSFLCDLSQIQDSFRFRCNRRSRLLAVQLIDEEGELKIDALSSFIEILEQNGFVIYPQGLNDGLFTKHVLSVLKRLRDDETIYKLIKRFHRPLCHKHAERIVHQSLGTLQGSSLSNAEIRRAVLSACFTILRQNIGSCFATAPAILIQKEKIEYFLNDLYELLTTGKLKRIFGGKEHTVPLSLTSGMGDLKKNIFLPDSRSKIWLSPGLVAAFETAGIIDPKLTLDEKIESVRRISEPYLAKGNEMSIEGLIHQILLAQFHLTDADVIKSSKIEREMAIRTRHALVPSNFGNLSQNLYSYYNMLEKESLAKEAFKGFADNALLKVWEFTLASFSEIKMEFSRWNLYSSLGLNPQEKGGIGQVIYQYLEEKLKQANEDAQKYQREYQVAFDQLRGTESLLRQAGSESEVRRLQAEYQSRMYEMQSCLEMRDLASSKASHYSTFYNFVIEQYDLQFQEYFQEIYDPEMIGLELGQYDDCPAGFRLVYKHGRKDPSSWTLIYTADQWIECLADFFKSVEQQLITACEWESGKDALVELTTAIVIHIQTEEFLTTAIERTLKGHGLSIKNPLAILNKLEKKPWSYTSGGTMTTLLQAYFRRETQITEESRQVENEVDLAIFILDALKSIPPLVYEKFLEDPEKGMLMQSPTHAFILHPGWDFISKGWQDNLFTYTWVRDMIFLPEREFYNEISLSGPQQRYLANAFFDQFGFQSKLQLKHVFKESRDGVSIPELRSRLLEVILTMPVQKQTACDYIDAFLFGAFPLIAGSSWKRSVRQLLNGITDGKLEDVLSQLSDAPSEWMTAKAFQNLAKACLLLSRHSACLNFDVHQYISDKAREIGLSRPKPFLFADSNWSNAYFALTVNPGTERLELWRMDITGSEGMPMSQWKEWLDGSMKASWVIYPRPLEYS